MFGDTSPYQEAPRPAEPSAERSGWSGSDLAIGGALIVLLIALFLPWFSAQVSPGRGTTVSGTGDGPTSHGYLWLVFVLAILALIVLVARDVIARLPGNLPSPEQMLVGTTGLAFLLALLGVLQKPSPLTTSPVPVISHLTVSVGWSYGGWVALVAALVAVIAAFREVRPPLPTERMTVLLLRRRGGS
jgi:uncharacterized membrane protein